jgi:preprotein translocase subunit YajC
MSGDTAIQLAQLAPDDSGAPGLNMLFFIGAMFVLMWALLIRPQQRQQKEHRKMLEQVKRGDQVVTNGGIHGRVTGMTDDVLTVEIAERVRVKVNRSAIASRRATEEAAPQGKDKARDAKEKSA